MDDESPMPFGKYKGTRIEKVPASYLLWLWEEGIWNEASDLGGRGDLHEYIKDSFTALTQEAKDFIITHKP